MYRIALFDWINSYDDFKRKFGVRDEVLVEGDARRDYTML